MLFPDASLARRLERERDHGQVLYARSFDRLYPDVHTAVEPIADGHAVYVGDTSPISRAVGLSVDGPVAPADLDRAEAFFFDRGMACRVDLSPFSDPTLIELAGRRGYRVAWFLNLLIRPIDAADQAPPPGSEVTVGLLSDRVLPTPRRPIWRFFHAWRPLLRKEIAKWGAVRGASLDRQPTPTGSGPTSMSRKASSPWCCLTSCIIASSRLHVGS